MQTIRSNDLEVMIDDITLSVTVNAAGQVWRMCEDGPGDLGVKGHCGPYQTFMFSQAKTRKWEVLSESSVQCTLMHWPYSANVWSPLAFGVTVTYKVENNKLIINLAPHRQEQLEASLVDSWYPRGFLFPEGSKGDLVLPISQGTLVDKDETTEYDLTLPVYVGPGFQMPWWGQLDRNGAGFVALTRTPDDLGFHMTNKTNGQGGTCHPYWQASLGGLKYTRYMEFQFFKKTSVIEMAKVYRQHADRIMGIAHTLREKVLDKPILAHMMGAAIWNVWLMSVFRARDTKNCDMVRYISFREAIRRYKELYKRSDIKKIMVHVDGWGTNGYDFDHPYILPPDTRLGGWKGFCEFEKAIHEDGNIFLLHNNYVDFYKHTETFKNNPDGVQNMDGLHHESREWLGGDQEWLCSSQGLKYVKRTLDELAEHCTIDGEYVDCWSIGHLRECYDQRHLCTRSDTKQHWQTSFSEYNNRGLLVGSESGNDWCVGLMDFCHTVQPDVVPHVLLDTMKTFGKSIPLYSMVWHDCLLIPAYINIHRQKNGCAVIKDGLVIPEKFDMRLWCLLWGGLPSYRLDIQENMTIPPDHDFDADGELVNGLKILSDFHGRIGYESITDWQMLDELGAVQKTTYSNGDSALVNFITGEYTLVMDGAEVTGKFDI